MAINWGKQDKGFSYTEEEDIREVLMGRKVESVSIFDREIVLDNGVVLIIEPNDGGCSCGAGDYYLEDLNTTDNIITKVEFGEATDKPDSRSAYDGGTRYSIFVYADNKKINLLDVCGDDGNGYYGSGYYITVRFPKPVDD